jgi:hypothetical protein
MPEPEPRASACAGACAWRRGELDGEVNDGTGEGRGPQDQAMACRLRRVTGGLFQALALVSH